MPVTLDIYAGNTSLLLHQRFGTHTRLNFDPHTASAALEVAVKKERPFALVILDVALPDGTGFGFFGKKTPEVAAIRAAGAASWAEVFEAFKEDERQWLGFSLSDPESTAIAAGL